MKKRIFISETDKKVCGVCGGIAEAYHLDSTVVRLIALLIALVTGIAPMLLVYIIAALLLPKKAH